MTEVTRRAPLQDIQPLYGVESGGGDRPIAQLRLKLGKKGTDSEAVVRSKLKGIKGAPSIKGCLFRGLNSYASLESSLRLLIPLSKGGRVEFGRGVYITNLALVLQYTSVTGGVFVFKTTDARKWKTCARTKQVGGK